jgi:molybdopterin/thiamine biosynthesis adenylyltransferase
VSNQISNRHESDLGGRFSPFGKTEQASVTLVIAPEAAHSARVQHTAWMLLNLLSRQQGVVSQIGLVCPGGVAQAGRVIPLAERQLDLRAALIAGNEAIGVVPLVPDQKLGRLLVIGATAPVESAWLYVVANGWCGGVSTTMTPIASEESKLPFGPYIAACLAAGEVFKAARLKPDCYSSPESVFYSAWTRSPSALLDPAGPLAVARQLDFALAGVGAVGCAFLHVLYSCPGVTGKAVLADNDEKGLEGSNLNRYVLFGAQSVGAKKATAAAHLLRDSAIEFDPHDQPVEMLSSVPQTVVSAVDTNPSRAAIQNRYPAEILSASTHDLRAEVLRCGPPGTGACLRCYNPPELAKSDRQIASEIEGMSDDELSAYANAAGVSAVEVRQWAASQKCGMAGEAVLKHFRQTQPQAQAFAVGFVSVIAGTLLAAELLMGTLDATGAVRRGNRSVFQFWTPNAPSNRSSDYLRDPACAMCRPDTPAVRIWSDRNAKRIQCDGDL